MSDLFGKAESCPHPIENRGFVKLPDDATGCALVFCLGCGLSEVVF